ncbi:hypothetical protein Salpa_4962 [Sporomusa sp. KB1]|jgi:hypothetical protein|nr:hypothetical protein Salpa_4962 [Sporomusa sp. KB1]
MSDMLRRVQPIYEIVLKKFFYCWCVFVSDVVQTLIYNALAKGKIGKWDILKKLVVV